MSVNVTIRRLRSDDAASFKAIRLEALAANPELLRSTLELEDKLDLTWFASRLEDAHIAGAFRGRGTYEGLRASRSNTERRMPIRADCLVCTFDQT